MPFLSRAQNSWAHTPNGIRALGGIKKVKEWESATDYSKLPDHAGGALSKAAGDRPVKPKAMKPGMKPGAIRMGMKSK